MNTISEQLNIAGALTIDLASSTPTSARPGRRILIHTVGQGSWELVGDAAMLDQWTDGVISSAVAHQVDVGALPPRSALTEDDLRLAIESYGDLLELATGTGPAIKLAVAHIDTRGMSTPERHRPSGATVPRRLPPAVRGTSGRNFPMPEPEREPLTTTYYRNSDIPVELASPAGGYEGAVSGAAADDDVRRWGPRADPTVLSDADLAWYRDNHPELFSGSFDNVGAGFRAELTAQRTPRHLGLGFHPDGTQLPHGHQPIHGYADADDVMRRPGESETDRRNRVEARDREQMRAARAAMAEYWARSGT